MKVAIDISPLKSAHQFRGIGAYTKQLVKALQSLRVADFAVELIGKGSPAKDCNLIHYPYFDLFWTTLPLIKKRRTVVTIHDVTPLVFPKHYPPGIKGRLKLQAQKLSLRRVEAVICDSKNSKNDIFNYLNYPKEKIFVVYLAPSTEFRPIKSILKLQKIKKKYKLPSKFVLYVGDVNYHKNILGLAKACKLIGFPLVIVGKQAAEKKFDRPHVENQPLTQLMKLYGKDPQIFRLGFVPEEDLVVIYNLATVYCQPSFYEGFGLPVIEAMACGTPVVTSKESSLPEVAGEAAVLIDPDDINDIANGLKLTLEDSDLREDLVQRGLKQAKKFSWERTAHETYKVYQKVV